MQIEAWIALATSASTSTPTFTMVLGPGKIVDQPPQACVPVDPPSVQQLSQRARPRTSTLQDRVLA